MKQNIQRIAVVRLSALGDVCHAIAVVTAIQKRYPEAQITWITGPLEAQLVSLMNNIDVRVYDKKSGIKGMLALRQALSSVSFDVLLHMQWSSRASLLTRMLKAKRRIGFARSLSREKQHWFVNELAPEPEGFHVLDAFWSLATAIGVKQTEPDWAINIPILPFDLPKGYVVLNPAGSKPSKNWSVVGYRKIVSLLRNAGRSVVLTGSPADRALCDAIAEGFELVNLAGKTSIADLVAVINGAAFVISPDTGPAHIATMVKTPVMALFALSNPERTGPYNDLHHVVSAYRELVEREQGKPLAQIPWATTVHAKDAMLSLDETAVLAKVQEMLRLP
ncbi:glycosyltransferase family 9 protein [Maribrevibacterium harenarium]|uniref:Glycosyltransferase family 9 protein n=1 Tax=Maribrevibacterium harenarium TaxID=2589817 RepID=A0A501WSE0_9GAMM|nr:glycosyltransferase family 9 protein [Maribrevibacterium harenarium]TPE51275.1 glycosyltransferase family 9 protein [Maribrevibacterium harenarium]